MAATQHETGHCASDGRLHATQKKISGTRALCGAGVIIQPMSGRFDTEDTDACPDCLRLVLDPAS